MFKALFASCILAGVLAFTTLAHAQELSGKYRNADSGEIVTFEKGSDGLITAKCAEWTAVTFWDAETKTYKAIFRYNASAPEAKKTKGKDAKLDLTVGFHTYAPQADGSLKVTYQWELNPKNGAGTYKLVLVK